MDAEKIQAVQSKLAALQENIRETVTDTEQLISITINGKMQVVDLSINQDLSIKEAESKLPHVITTAIMNASRRVQEALKIAMQ